MTAREPRSRNWSGRRNLDGFAHRAWPRSVLGPGRGDGRPCLAHGHQTKGVKAATPRGARAGTPVSTRRARAPGSRLPAASSGPGGVRLRAHGVPGGPAAGTPRAAARADRPAAGRSVLALASPPARSAPGVLRGRGPSRVGERAGARRRQEDRARSRGAAAVSSGRRDEVGRRGAGRRRAHRSPPPGRQRPASPGPRVERGVRQTPGRHHPDARRSRDRFRH
jgi:hypothetical protein